MGQKLVVGPINQGLRKDVKPFNIDNDNFPQLINAYQWRGRVKRKRGTELLGRLKRHFDSTNVSYTPGGTVPYTITLNGSGEGNLISDSYTNGTSSFSLQTNGNIVPNTVTVTDTVSAITYTDNGDGTFSPSGSINYATGLIIIAAAATHAITAVFDYFPDLPVMGLRDFDGANFAFPGTLGFDTTYSYNLLTAPLYPIYDVSFYKNPSTGDYPGYTEKTNITPTTWNGQTYQQFWTINYQGALWATNGVTVPFNPANVGMQYQPISLVDNITAGPPAVADLTIANHGLVVGDFLFINEIVGVTGINYQTGYITAVVSPNKVTVEFPNATLGGVYSRGGIAQYLTNRSDSTKDCLRWYDGDPTSAAGTLLNGHLGWVNFAPPLSEGVFSIADEPEQIYYLVGAKIIFPFKDRLVFFGPVIQTSSANSQVYLKDTIIYSQNGTPYYTASFTSTNDYPLNPTEPGYVPILVPQGQSSSPVSYWEDVSGFGGFLDSGLDQAINTVDPNEDVLIVGFDRFQTRLVYTGNDLLPFNFFTINAEYGSGSTFSAVTLDKGVVTMGSRGFLITSQVESRRIDLDIPDDIFQVNYLNNGRERVCAQRDYISEWIYFTYPVNTSNAIYPTQTLQFNYRDNSWGMFFESYTSYGLFRKQTGFVWSTVGFTFPTWAEWNQPWNAGTSTALQPLVIAGNQQGFVLIRNQGTGEGNSLYIQNISNSTVTSPSHSLNSGDYIVISGCLGTVASEVNGKIFSIANVTTDTFELDPMIFSGLTYLGNGVIKKMYVPFIQTKQFPLDWADGRKVRIGPQRYLLTRTANAQVTLLIFLSQNGDTPYNDSPIVPNPDSWNKSLVYSTVLYTRPENYIQACNNKTLGNIGNGFVLLFAFNYNQIFQLNNQSFVPGSVYVNVGDGFATFTDNGQGGFTITGFGVGVGSTINYDSSIITLQFSVPPANASTVTNFNYYVNNIQSPTAGSQREIWHRLNTSLLGDTVQIGFTLSDAQMRDENLNNQFSEIELHSAILEINPSSLLA